MSTENSSSYDTDQYFDFNLPKNTFDEHPNPQPSPFKNTQSNSKFDDYPSQQYTDFSKTDYYFQDQNPSNNSQSSSLDQKQDLSSFSLNAKSFENESQNLDKLIQKIQDSSEIKSAKKQSDLRIKDILNLQSARQQTLLTLSEQDFKKSDQYQFFESKTFIDWQLAIANHYKNDIYDEQFKNWLRKTNKYMHFSGVTLWTSVFGLLIFVIGEKLKYLPKVFGNSNLALIPWVGLLIGIQTQKYQTNKSKEFLKKKQNDRIMTGLIRRFLCNTTLEERHRVNDSK